METNVRNPKMNRLRRYLWQVPLLALLLGTLLYWALDDGLSNEQEESKDKKKSSVYLTLPGSMTADDTLLDKMSYYEMADRDSAKFRELARNDPYYRDALSAEEDPEKKVPMDFSFFEKENGTNTSLTGSQKNKGSHYRKKTWSNDQSLSEEEDTFTARKKKSGTNTSSNESQKNITSNYWQKAMSDVRYGSEDTFSPRKKKSKTNAGLLYGQSNDPYTDQIYRKLRELNREINKPVPTAKKNKEEAYQTQEGNNENTGTPVDSSDVAKLEKMIQAMNQPAGEDPELKQLSAMLDKILDVQHPERIREKLKKTSEADRGKVFAVSSQKKDGLTSSKTKSEVPAGTNAFYSLSETSDPENSQNAIQAVVHQTQTVVDGSIVKLRLVNDVFINGVRIPKDNFLYGIASLNGERLSIKINRVRYHNSLFPVELSVYDMDGLDGIYIPGAITREVAKQSADRSLQTLGLTSVDSSLGVQAAGAGIEAARTLLSQKVKQIKVTVKAGYQVLLQDEKQTQAS